MPVSARAAAPTLACALIALLSAGCAAKDPFGTRGRGQDTAGHAAYAEPADKSPGYDLVRAAMGTAIRIRTLDAVGTMKLDDRRQDMSVRVNTNILVQRPAHMRLLATKVSREVLEIALAGDSVDVWVPGKRTLHRGDLRELTGGDMDFHPDEIVGQILFPVERFLAVPWEIVSETAEETVVAERAPRGHASRLAIRPADQALLRHEIYTAGGRLWMRAVFADHKPLAGMPAGPPFPHRMTLSFPEDEREIAITLRQITVNPEVQAADFWLIVPDEGITVKPLQHSMRLTAEALGDDAAPPPGPSGIHSGDKPLEE